MTLEEKLFDIMHNEFFDEKTLMKIEKKWHFEESELFKNEKELHNWLEYLRTHDLGDIYTDNKQDLLYDFLNEIYYYQDII